MWECPDFFTLDGQNVLIVSTMEMEAEELEYPNGNGVVCQIGHFDNQTGQFHSISSQSVDYGIDFYAPQTMLAPDGQQDFDRLDAKSGIGQSTFGKGALVWADDHSTRIVG